MTFKEIGQQLHSKRARELTEDEIGKIYDEMPGGPKAFARQWGYLTFAKALFAAHQRKQQEPETVTFRAARHKADNRVSMLQVIDDANIASCWEWLEPAQTIEVKLP